MKIIENKEVFKPVTVVFESQAEINFITALIGNTNTPDFEAITKTYDKDEWEESISFKMFDLFEKYATDLSHVDVIIKVKEIE